MTREELIAELERIAARDRRHREAMKRRKEILAREAVISELIVESALSDLLRRAN